MQMIEHQLRSRVKDREKIRDDVKEMLFGGKEVAASEKYSVDRAVDDIVNGLIYYEEDKFVKNEYVLVNTELEDDTPEQRKGFIKEVINVTNSMGSNIDSEYSAMRNILPEPETLVKIIQSGSNKITDYKERLTAHLLRTAAYWATAGAMNIPFMVDFMRIPIIASYNKTRLKQPFVREYIRSRMDEYTRRRFMTLASPKLIPILDAASNFLIKYHSMKSMEEAFRGMRKDFEKQKKQIVKWEDGICQGRHFA